MNKTLRSIAIFMIVFISIAFIPRIAKAEEDLTILEWVVDGYLLETGDLQITEDITFKFNDKFNGVFREVMLNGTSGVSNIRVKEVTGGASREYTHAEKAKNGDSGVFLTKEERDKITIQIFSPSKNQGKTFRISYLVKNVAIRYNDIGELYYKFLGDENETPIGSFRVNIRLPQGDTNSKVKVFAHGPLNGKISKQNDTTYSLYVNNVPTNTFIEGRVLFPREFIPASRNAQNKNNYSNILDEEAAFQNKLKKDMERRQAVKSVLGKVSLIASGFGFVLLIILALQFRREKDDYQDGEYFGIPEDCTPAVASLITGTIADTNTIFATILDLFRKGYLKISEDQDDTRQKRKIQNFIISRVREADSSLLKHERYFINWLFNEMGNGMSVSTDQIKDFGKSEGSEFYGLYSGWKTKIKADAVEKGYYDRSKRVVGIALIILSIPLLILGIAALAYGNLLGLLSLAIESILLIYGIILFNRLSDYGYRQYRKWMGFRKYMKKYDLDLSKEDFSSSMDVSLIYALGLGVVKKPNKFKFDNDYGYNGAYQNNSWIFWYLIFANDSNNAFHKSIDNGFKGSTGSYSGGSFSSGGGGGAGGGGAGGF